MLFLAVHAVGVVGVAEVLLRLDRLPVSVSLSLSLISTKPTEEQSSCASTFSPWLRMHHLHLPTRSRRIQRGVLRYDVDVSLW